MDDNAITSHCNVDNQPLENSTPRNEHKKAEENSMNTSVFVNHAAISWDESRRKWIGDLSPRPQTLMPAKDPTISWTTTYDDLLSTSDPFPKPVPLAEMVDFLVDIWEDEGLFD